MLGADRAGDLCKPCSDKVSPVSAIARYQILMSKASIPNGNNERKGKAPLCSAERYYAAMRPVNYPRESASLSISAFPCSGKDMDVCQ